MYSKLTLLKATVAALVGAVILITSGSYNDSQQHVRQLSAVTKGGGNFDDKLQSLSAKIHSEGAADIWLINQPKCGTGYLERVITSTLSLDCKLYGDKEATRFFDCGDDKMFFRTHNADSATRVKTLFDLWRSRNKSRPDRCVAISAVRSPLQSIPSRFFQSHRELCDGSMPLEDVIKMYEEYLASPLPASQVLTIADVVRTFTGKNVDLYHALTMLAENGVAFLDGAEPNSPWAGCELIILQIDHDEDGTNVDHTMGVLFPGESNPLKSRSQLCPNAVESIEAIYNYELTDQHLDGFAQIHPEMRDLFRYYRENPDPRPARTA